MIKYKLIILLLLTSSYLAVYAENKVIPGSVRYLDYKNGFRGVHFGDSPETLKKVDKCINGVYKYYKLNDEINTDIIICTLKTDLGLLLGRNLAGITYRYYKNKLFKIVIHWEPNKKISQDGMRNRLPENFMTKDPMCELETIGELRNVWGNEASPSLEDMNPFISAFWVGSKVKAEVNRTCTSLTLTDIFLDGLVQRNYMSNKLKKLDDEF